MLKNWFYRLLLSYLPVFLFITAILLLSSFVMLSDLSKKAAVKSNEVFAQYALQNIDNVLKSVDQAMIREIFADDGIANFMRKSNYSAYDAALRLKQMKEETEWIDSVYLVRESDGVVITENKIMSQERFGDREFLQQLRQSRTTYAWTNIREFGDGQSEKRHVVSLAKLINNASTGGILVVNVSADKVSEMLKVMSGSTLSYIRLLDSNNNSISSTGLDDGLNSVLDEWSVMKSDYTNYQIRSGVKYISFLDRISTFTYSILGLGLLSILFGIGWIVYISRRNYKPVERIVNRIETIGKQKTPSQPERLDEFKVIEEAIERMAEDSERFEKRHEENLLYKQQVLFLELLEGKRHIPENTPNLYADEFGMDADSGLLQVAVIELDGYTSFVEKFSVQDQNLLKFVLEKTANEISKSHEISTMTEWTAHNQFSMLFQFSKSKAVQSVGDGIATELLQWVKDNLPFTVTISFGFHVEGISKVPKSYALAINQLHYKASLGNNRIIQPSDLQNRSYADLNQIVQLIRPFIQSYKHGDQNWHEKLDYFFDQLRQSIFTSEDLTSVLNYFTYQFHREMADLNAEFRMLWEHGAMPKLSLLLERTETLDQVQHELLHLLIDISGEMILMRERRNHTSLLKQMRNYIDEHYGNPDLSLTMLGDGFSLNSKYMSRLFKEEYGVNFGDYLLNVRMNHAKQILENSMDSIQDTAIKVGYTTSIAFIRAFKKTFGITPGDYRKSTKTG